MARALKALINRTALKHNLNRVKQIAPGKKIIAMIKAHAYGHGLNLVTDALEEADAFGVASIDEALELREQGVKKRIILMEGFFHPNELKDIIHHDFEPVIHHWGQVQALTQNHLASMDVWIKVNTGMNRLGFSPKDFPLALEQLTACASIRIKGIMTHFSCADQLDNPQTRQQMALFDELTRDVPGEKSLANSAGIIAWPDAHGDCVRPGIMLFGASPFPGCYGYQTDLRPVMTLQTELIAKHHIVEGERVGYGGIFVAPDSMPIGIIAVGYGDGYPRHAPYGTPVLVGGKRVPLIGRVSMDMCAVDLREASDAKVGDTVVLWGEGLPVEEVAAKVGTVPYELLTGLSPRVRHEALDSMDIQEKAGEVDEQSITAT